METNSSGRRILALSDGRAGNAAMALGLAEAVAGRLGVLAAHRAVALPSWVSALPAPVAARLPPALLLRSLAAPLPEIAIGAGRRVAPLLTAIRQRGGRAVQILDSGIAPERFDLVVTPSHDALRGPNVLTTLGSVHRVTKAVLAEEWERWAESFGALPAPRIAVLIGGATRRTGLVPERVAAFAVDLASLGREASLMVTVSRRTGAEATAELRAAVPEAWFWAGRGENPYFGMLGWADAILVTDDSVNMASEAAATGKPLAIWPLLREGGKIARFHEELFARGYAEPFSGSGPQRQPPAPLLETPRVAAEICARLEL